MAWEGTQTGKLTRTDQGDTPGHVTACSAVKLGGKVPFPEVAIAQGLTEHSASGECWVMSDSFCISCTTGFH